MKNNYSSVLCCEMCDFGVLFTSNVFIVTFSMVGNIDA